MEKENFNGLMALHMMENGIIIIYMDMYFPIYINLFKNIKNLTPPQKKKKGIYKWNDGK